MARNKGTFKFGANFEVQTAEAFDPRVVVSTKTELINKETWPYDGDTIYVYNGLIVGVADEKSIYMLINRDQITDPSYAGWKRMDSEAAAKIEIIDDLASTSTTAALSANQGKVLGDRVTTLESKITEIFTFKGKKKTKSELPLDGTQKVGDVWHVTEDNGEYVWDNTNWELLGLSVNLSGYALKTEVTAAKEAAIAHADDIKSTLDTALLKKVTVEEGKSLIETAKINQIDTNSSNITTLQNNVTSLTTTVGDINNGLVKDVTDLKTAVTAPETGLVAKVGKLETEISNITANDNVCSIDNTETAGISLAQGATAKSVKVSVNTKTLASTISSELSASSIKIGEPINSGITATAEENIYTVIGKLAEAVKTTAAGGITVLSSQNGTVKVTGTGNERQLDVVSNKLVKEANQSSLAAGADNKIDLVWIEINN